MPISICLYSTNYTCVWVYYLTGCSHRCIVKLCECESEQETLVRYNLWPATPTITNTAIAFGILENLALLQMESHMPVQSFCQAMEGKVNLIPNKPQYVST